MTVPKNPPDAALELPCEPPTLRIVERLGEPIDEPGECRVQQGSPCILFGDWDYAEDWSGEFVRVVQAEPLSTAPRISIEEFWELVRKLHA